MIKEKQACNDSTSITCLLVLLVTELLLQIFQPFLATLGVEPKKNTYAYDARNDHYEFELFYIICL